MILNRDDVDQLKYMLSEAQALRADVVKLKALVADLEERIEQLESKGQTVHAAGGISDAPHCKTIALYVHAASAS